MPTTIIKLGTRPGFVHPMTRPIGLYINVLLLYDVVFVRGRFGRTETAAIVLCTRAKRDSELEDYDVRAR